MIATMKKTAVLLILLALPGPAALYAQDAASLQFSVAAPDPVMAGEQVRLQTLVVNTGVTTWQPGTYYWAGEVYALEGEERRFLAQTETVSPAETVAPGAASGVQIPFTVPVTLQGRRLLYRVFLIKDGRRIMETDYKGFQVIEKELRPPPPQDFRIGGDITLSYRNSSERDWRGHQGVTAANFVGKVRQSSFLFNTYMVHTYHRPITPSIILLNYYAPWGNLAMGDISPSLTPLSMDGQGMRGVSYERTRDKLSLLLLLGRIVAPEEPGDSTAGRFARLTGGFKASWQFTPALRVSADAVLSRDDEHSINISSDTNTLVPQQNFVYGLNAEWRPSRSVVSNTDFKLSSYQADMRTPEAVSGAAWKQELKYRGSLVTGRAAVSQVDTNFASFASPSVIADRRTVDAELGFFPADWETLTVAYNTYTDNLGNDPGKTTTTQAQTTISNALRLFGKTMVNLSLINNATVGKPAGVQNNQTDTVSLSVTQPWKAHTLSLSLQGSSFSDKTGLSHDLDTSLLSLNGSFKVTSRMSASAGVVSSQTRDKVDSTTGSNNSLTGNVSYAMPRRAMAVQFWTTLATNKNDSALSRADASSLSLNGELVWVKNANSRFTFGAGLVSRTDKVNPGLDSSHLSLLTRYNYSF
jgi:hypothetical protein